MISNKTSQDFANVYLKEKALAEKNFKDYLKIWAEEKCPYKVGETYTVPSCAYSQEGKEFKVVTVNTYHWYRNKYEWTIIGTIMKKDGTPGLRIVNFRVPIDMEE